MELTSQQKRWLRGQAHGLDPVVQVGRGGLSEAVVRETVAALERHELIKVRLAGERDERRAQTTELVEVTGSELVGAIGKVAILYRQNSDADARRIKLP